MGVNAQAHTFVNMKSEATLCCFSFRNWVISHWKCWR